MNGIEWAKARLAERISDPDTLARVLAQVKMGSDRLSLAYANLNWADLSGGKFSEANLSGLDLIGANLIDADLREANLGAANLKKAVLLNADLSGANLRLAYLYKADLGGANLSGADLRHAELYFASLDGTNLADAIVNWASHDLMYEILRRASDGSEEQEQLLHVVLKRRDWCWWDYVFYVGYKAARWAANALKPYIIDRRDAPDVLLYVLSQYE
jgi:hypothetical protein